DVRATPRLFGTLDSRCVRLPRPSTPAGGRTEASTRVRSATRSTRLRLGDPSLVPEVVDVKQSPCRVSPRTTPRSRSPRGTRWHAADLLVGTAFSDLGMITHTSGPL